MRKGKKVVRDREWEEAGEIRNVMDKKTQTHKKMKGVRERWRESSLEWGEQVRAWI